MIGWLSLAHRWNRVHWKSWNAAPFVGSREGGHWSCSFDSGHCLPGGPSLPRMNPRQPRPHNAARRLFLGAALYVLTLPPMPNGAALATLRLAAAAPPPRSEEFERGARTPDHPRSLFEGWAAAGEGSSFFGLGCCPGPALRAVSSQRQRQHCWGACTRLRRSVKQHHYGGMGRPIQSASASAVPCSLPVGGPDWRPSQGRLPTV